MQPNPSVLKALEDVLQAEIAAINSYFIHAKLLANWGYGKLSTKAYEESMDEMRHTEQLVDRIVYFDAIPNLNKIGRVKVGSSSWPWTSRPGKWPGSMVRSSSATRPATTGRAWCSSPWSLPEKAPSTGSRPSSRRSTRSATAHTWPSSSRSPRVTGSVRRSCPRPLRSLAPALEVPNWGFRARNLVASPGVEWPND